MKTKIVKRITILLTLYKATEKDIKYWLSIKEDIKKLSDFVVVVDGVDKISNELINEYSKFGADVVYLKNNLGKAGAVIEGSRKIKTDHFKSVDPDDRIDLKNLKKFTAEYSAVDLKGIHIVNSWFTKFLFLKIKKSYKNSDFIMSKNWSSIYPTKEISEINNFSTRTLGEDQFLTSKLNSVGIKQKKMNIPFQTYIYKKGVSTPKKHWTPEQKDLFIKEVILFIEDIKKIDENLIEKFNIGQYWLNLNVDIFSKEQWETLKNTLIINI
jgi:hypothetical protein